MNRIALTEEIKGVQKAVDADYSAMKTEETGLTALLETAKKRALELNLSEIELQEAPSHQEQHGKGLFARP